MITNTARHAIRALILLAQLGDAEYAGAAAVAQEIGAPQNYLGKLLQVMCKQGLVLSHKGHGGGFRLARDPNLISLYDVVDPIDGLSRKNGCILGQLLCTDNSPCPAHDRFIAIVTAQERFLKETTIAQLTERYRAKKTRKQTA